MSRHFGMSVDRTAQALKAEGFTLGTLEPDDPMCPIFVGPWSAHVNSWCDEKHFPVLLIRYEDLLERTEEMLRGVIEFLFGSYDEVRGRKAIKAASLKNLQKAEGADGFQEKSSKADRFFSEGGQRWKQELGPKIIAEIESDNREVMKRWGYL
jgi:hypothetical protein